MNQTMKGTRSYHDSIRETYWKNPQAALDAAAGVLLTFCTAHAMRDRWRARMPTASPSGGPRLSLGAAAFHGAVI